MKTINNNSFPHSTKQVFSSLQWLIWGKLTWMNQDDRINKKKSWQQRAKKIEDDQNWNWQTLTLCPGSS